MKEREDWGEKRRRETRRGNATEKRVISVGEMSDELAKSGAHIYTEKKTNYIDIIINREI